MARPVSDAWPISVCVAVGDVADELVEQAEERASLRCALRAAWRRDADMGPLVTSAHREKVQGYIDHGVADGARSSSMAATHEATSASRIFPRRNAVR